MLPTDYAFTKFLAFVGRSNLRYDAAAVAIAALSHTASREYEAQTRSLAHRGARARGRRRAEVHAIALAKAALVRDPVRVHDVHDVPVPTVANFATTRPKFTFTDAQIAIAIGVQEQQLTKAS